MFRSSISKARFIAPLLTNALALAVGFSALSAELPMAEGWTPSGKRVAPADGLVNQVKPKGVTPRDAAGRPDLTGMWTGGEMDSRYTGFGIRSGENLEPDQVALQRAAGVNKPIYKPELWSKVYNADYGEIGGDPAFHCQPRGVPRMQAPAKIVQVGDQIVMMNTGGYGTSQPRFIPFDGRKHDEIDSDFATYNGIPVARWEGDTLVVESVGFNDLTWFGWTGYFHSDRMTVTERFRREGDVLYYSFTVNDPEVLAMPWVSDTFIGRLSTDPLARMEESPPCKENDLEQITDKYYRG